MPRCEGLPDGPCPKTINNETVRLTQGDLMLCPSCDSVRFPPVKCTTSSSNSNSTYSRKPSATVHGANTAPSVSVINTATATTVNTATAQHSDTAENKTAKITVANNNASCPVCCDVKTLHKTAYLTPQ